MGQLLPHVDVPDEEKSLVTRERGGRLKQQNIRNYTTVSRYDQELNVIMND